MIHLRLSDGDRERLGCPKVLDVDLHSVTVREASILQRGFDLDGEQIAFEHPGAWRAALTSDQGLANYPAWLVLIWLALRRAGITVALSDLDFDLDGLGYKQDLPESDEPEDPEASPGKGDEPEPLPSNSAENTISTL